MDILRKFCNAVPDGMTRHSIANSLGLAFVEAIEKDLISDDFTQNEIDLVHPELVSCPSCDTYPALPFVIAILDMVYELEAFRSIDPADSIRNPDGEEYSTLVRNLVSPSGEYTDGARKVGESVDKIWKDVKNTYPHYYRVLRRDDGDDLLLEAYIKDGKKKYSLINQSRY